MIVISDTTPIISLLKANQLELLEKLYGKVLIPEAVYRELTNNPYYEKEAQIIKMTKFLSAVPVENIKSVSVLRNVTGLDMGESEALILYDEQKADLLLIDERKGRNVAKQLKVKCIGTAGILMLAYDLDLMQPLEIQNCINTMLANHIRLDTKICNLILTHAGIEPL
ncbi:MAG: DUF3368 domain-containing protein [Eubacterium sp.]|nr:DUF3368 domain-containing protein [Eubacterium sp.]